MTWLIYSGSSLDHLNLLDILPGVGTLYSGTVFKQRSDHGTICSGLGLFVVDPQVSSKKS